MEVDMGGVKAAMMEHEDNLAVATAYLVEIGSLEECEAHGLVFGGGAWDLEPDFWKRVMGERKRGDRGSIPWAAEMKTREFTDLIKEAYESHFGDRCAHCDKIMAE
ncbi:hypothetical protein OEG84_03890 [Hoeflea sp. G2-23]|uniref:Uncharacterized protein n=1 Tax=Hoeflea algicola TaxID=2983763 RepID=A0ABT3Z595_9HYPH|nr:hypothetical protein [Hoeflea algicola]MCY0146879.1 hypothetical protein [Hoeflea algicola]